MNISEMYDVALYVGVGAGAALALVKGYHFLKKPTIVYEHTYFEFEPSAGFSRIVLKGAKFPNKHSVTEGKDVPRNLENMLNLATMTIKNGKMGEQAGINEEDGVYKVRIEITK